MATKITKAELEAELNHAKKRIALLEKKLAGIASENQANPPSLDEARYHKLFEESPIALWEEDYSQVKIRLNQLKSEGVTDLYQYLSEHPDLAAELPHLVKILDVNRATLELFEAENKEDLFKRLGEIVSLNNIMEFVGQMIALAEGATSYFWTGINQTLKGRKIYIQLYISILPGYEESLGRVVVSIMNVDELRRAQEELHKSNERYQSIAEDMPLMISRFKHDGTLTYVNRFYCEYYKTTARELIGKNLFELVPDNEREFVMQKFLSLSADQPFISYEFQAFDADGAERWQRWTDRALFNENGEIIEFQSVGEDITERKETEQLLIESEARFRSLIANAGDMILVIDAQGFITYASPSFERSLGYPPEDALDENFMDWIHPDDLPLVKTAFESCRKTPGTAPQSIKVRGKHKDGSWHYLDALGTNLLDIPSIKGIVLNIRDVTENEWAEQLAQSTIDALSAHICVLDKNGRVVSVNRAWREFADANPPLLENYAVGMNYLKATEKAARSKAEGAAEVAAKLKELLAGAGDSFTSEYSCHSPKEKRWFICRATKFEGSETFRVVITHENITSQKIFEETLKESEARFLSAFENASIGMALVSLDGVMYQSNPAMCDFLGYPEDELIKLTFQEITHPDDLGRDLQNLQQLLDGVIENYQMDKRYRHKLGHYIWGSLSVSLVKNERGAPLYFVSQIKDITERKNTEAALNRQLSELETLYESGLVINSLYNSREIAQKVIDILERRMAWHHIVIRQYNADANTVEILAFYTSGLTPEQNEEQAQKVDRIITRADQGLTGWVIMNGVSLRVPQVRKDSRYAETYSEIQSGLYAPLKIGSRVIGAISVESIEEDAFTEQDERLLVTLAAQAAVSIENATLHLTSLKEIAERKQAEAALQKQTEELVLLNSKLESRVKDRTKEIEFTRQRLELATRAAGLGIWEWNINDGTMIWDNQMYNIFGQTPDTFDNTMIGFKKFIHPDDLEFFTNLMNEIIDGRTYFELGYRIVRPDGSIRFLHSHGLGLSDHHGEVERMIGTIDDVTLQKESEQAVIENEAYARLLFDASPDPIFVAEADGIMVDVNKIFEKQHNVKRDEIRGKHISELHIFPPEDVKKAGDYISEIMQGKKMPPVELDFFTAENGLHTLEMNSYPIQVYGRMLVLSTSRDITERKLSADILRRANNEMERALRIKDEFLASMSHELRTPMNAILGISESLEEQIIGPLNEKQVKYLHTVSESGHHLLELINDILDLSKIEAGRIELNVEQMSAEHLVQSSLRIIKEMAQKKGLNLSVNVDSNVKTIKGDERRLKQVLVNLLSNAVKFTPQGGEIGLDMEGHPDHAEISITVWDNGIGIKQENIGRLFKPFVQLDSSLSREYAGTGLGLALVAQMVRLHGGSISLTSEVGKGSRFTVTLPWEVDNQPASVVYPPLETPAMHPLKIERSEKVMVFEDTESISQLLDDYISYLGYKVVVARNGLEGLTIARRERPDIIFMDIMMPGMNGLEAARQIRTDEYLKDTPIIALTALAMPGDREQCLEAGMNDYLSKPIRMNEIHEMISKYLVHP